IFSSKPTARARDRARGTRIPSSCFPPMVEAAPQTRLSLRIELRLAEVCFEEIERLVEVAGDCGEKVGSICVAEFGRFIDGRADRIADGCITLGQFLDVFERAGFERKLLDLGVRCRASDGAGGEAAEGHRAL